MSDKHVFISWDVDGTLLMGPNHNEAHHAAFRGAIQEFVAPLPSTIEAFLGHPVNGYMDSMIIVEILGILGVEATSELSARIQSRAEELYREAAPVPTVCEGIPEILEYLASQPNVTMGVASGNFPGVAWYKLEAVGLLKYFPDRIGGFGTFGDRKDAILAAIGAAEKVRRVTFDVKLHAGDTLTDSDAAIRAGVIPFLVRTGRHPFAECPKEATAVDNLRVGRDQFMALLGLE
jgi:phosphoglycolate phosphatase-like HAD superfamily hydrolase